MYSNVKYTITQYYIVNICVKAHYVNTNVCINKNFQLTKCLSRGCLKAFSNVVLIKIILLSSSSNMGYYLPYKNIIMAFASSVRLNTVTNWKKIMFTLRNKPFSFQSQVYKRFSILHNNTSCSQRLNHEIWNIIYWQYFQVCFFIHLGLCISKCSRSNAYMLIYSICFYRILKLIRCIDKRNADGFYQSILNLKYLYLSLWSIDSLYHRSGIYIQLTKLLINSSKIK